MADLAKLNQKLEAHKSSEADKKKFLAYISDASRQEASKDRKPVSGNSEDVLYSLYVKYQNLGLVIDGVNVVITGKNMAMVTFHGYKNQVLKTYPETEFDYGLVREGDTFKVSKDSGHVRYDHDIADPFSANKIIGAYVVFKNKRGEYFEALGEKDYSAMKGASRQSSLWNTWDSEFWLKSVIKRACKRNFFDIVADIDKQDNDDYGVADSESAEQGEVDQALDQISKVTDSLQLDDFLMNLPTDIKKAVTPQAMKKYKELDNGNTAEK